MWYTSSIGENEYNKWIIECENFKVKMRTHNEIILRKYI